MNPSVPRQIVLDTETTGLEHAQGHRIIEIGCVELINRRLTGQHFHHYLQPDREIDAEAEKVHGISSAFLADKPRFPEIAEALLAFVQGAELLIHNAAFDIGFLNNELRLAGRTERLDRCCTVADTLTLARRLHPGQRNTLDALCKRYAIDNSQRTRHGALLDAEILADVYLAMTREQVTLLLESETVQTEEQPEQIIRRHQRPPLRVVRADAGEQSAHERYLDKLDKSAGGSCLWRRLQTP